MNVFTFMGVGLPIGSGERIRTTDRRVMSPTSYHCSTPRYGWRTDLVSHTATVQYLQRWCVSRPGSGWDGVGPHRFMHANGSERSLTRAHLQHCVSSRTRSSSREALSHAHWSPPHVTMRPARAAYPSNLLGALPDIFSEYTHLGGYFPLRCFQRFLRPDVDTEPAGRPTIPPLAVRPIRSSRTKISFPQCTNRS